MRTIQSTGPLVFSVQTDKQPGVPPGKIHVRCVRYEIYEFDREEFDSDDLQFNIHDASAPEARELARVITGANLS